MHHMDQINGEIFNVGGGQKVSVSLQELTEICQRVTGKTIPIRRELENRPADIRLYLTDNSKVTRMTGWEPQIGVEQIVQEITDWIRANEAALAPILS